jgi:RNA polymerase sigma factor (sigma-70 family)
MHPAGLEAVYLANRDTLLRFLRARGAGDAAEDLLQELWLKITATTPTGPIAAPLSYLYRAADTLMIDRHRARRQAEQRDRDWSEAVGPAERGRSDEPSGERVVAARQGAQAVEAVLAKLDPRAAAIFRRHRVDGMAQRAVAAEFGVSLSTVESDLRAAYRALAELRERLDEA